jgi:hypothetical protein
MGVETPYSSKTSRMGSDGAINACTCAHWERVIFVPDAGFVGRGARLDITGDDQESLDAARRQLNAAAQSAG